MKKMKFMAFVAATFLTVSSLVYFNSCKKDACKDVICNNGGVCADGNCTCTTGYEGADCSTDVTLKLTGTGGSGTYTAANDVLNGNSQSSYNPIIASTSTIGTVKISNMCPYDFGNTNQTFTGTVNFAAKTITVPATDPTSTGYTLAAVGTYSYTASGVSISWAYTFTKTSTSQALTGTGTWTK